MNFKLAIILFSVFFLHACTTTTLPSLSESDVPQRWALADQDEALSWPDQDWWKSFESSELSQIIARVEAYNLDLSNNVRNLEQAQLRLREAGFDLYPTPVLDVGLNSRYSGLRPAGGSYNDGSDTTANLGLGLNYNDILSKPTQYAAALARFDGDIARLADVRLNTLSTSASTYFQILLIRDRITAAEQNLNNAEALARIIQARADAGTVTSLDALQQRIAVARQRNNLKTLQQNELAARSSLALLMTASVNDLEVISTTLNDVQIPEITPGLPSELLLRRPDLVAAEADLRLFRANVDLARLAFLPNISLTAAAGIVSPTLSGILDSRDIAVTGSGGLLQTLLDNGARKRTQKSTELDLESSLANYRKAAISAFNEIEVSLGNIALLESLADVAKEDLARAEEAYRIASVRYREGVAQYQTVLSTQDTLFAVRNDFLDNKLARINSIIALYQSLGGGWERAKP